MIRRILYNLVPVLVPLIVLALAGAKLISQRGEWVRQQLPHILKSELWARTGRQVRVGTVEGDLLRGITVRDIAIAAAEGFEAGESLAADQVRIRYNLVELLRGKVGPLAAIRELTIIGPTVSATRDRDGTVDVYQMFAPKKPRRPTDDRIMVPIEVRGAKLSYTDLSLLTRGGRPLVLRLDDVDASLDTSRRGRTSVALSGSNPDGLAGSVETRVEYFSSPASFSVSAEIDNAAIGRWARIVPRTLPVTVARGTADVRGILHGMRGEDGKWELGYNIGSDVAGAAVTIPQLGGETVSLSGRVRVTPATLMISHVEASSPMGHATASGAIFDLLHEPHMDLEVAVEGVDVAAALAPFDLPESVPTFAVHGEASADVAITGAMPHLGLNGTVRLPGGHVTEERVGIGGVLVGPVDASLDVEDLAEPRVAVKATISDLSTDTETGRIWEAAPFQLSTIQAEDGKATVTWSRSEGFEVAGELNGLAAAIPAGPETVASLAGASCTFRATGGGVSFGVAAEQVLGGSADVWGAYEAAPESADGEEGAAGTLRLTGSFAGLDAAALGKLPWRQAAETAAEKPPEGDEATDEEKGGFQAALAKVQAGRVTSDYFELTYDDSGLGGQMVAEARCVQYDDQPLPDADIAAAVSARRAEADEESTWRVGDGRLSLHAQDHRGDAWVAAEVEPAGDGTGFRALFAAADIGVAEIAALLDQADVGGRGRASGWVAGTWEQATNQWQIEDSSIAAYVEAPRFKKHVLDFLALGVGGSLEDLTVHEARAGRGDAGVVVDGSVEIDLEKKDAQLELRASAGDSSIADWLALGNVEYDVGGTCRLEEGKISGSITSPRVSGQVHVADATAYAEPIEEARADVEYVGEELRLTNVWAKSRGGTLERGNATITGFGDTPRIAGTFRATGIDAQRIPAVAEADLPVRAVFDGWGAVQIMLDDPHDPDVTAVLHLGGQDVAVGEHPIWDLAATVVYAGDVVRVQPAVCRAFGGRLRAGGMYDVDDGRFALDLSIDEDRECRTWIIVPTIADILEQPDAKPHPLRTIGRRFQSHVGGTVSVGGTLADVTGHGKFKFSQATLNKLYVPDIGVTCDFTHTEALDERVFRVSNAQFALREGEAELTAGGEITVSYGVPEPPTSPEPPPVRVAWLGSFPTGLAAAEPPPPANAPRGAKVEADLTLRARNVELQRVARWLPYDLRLGGSMRFDAEMHGSVGEPSIEVRDLRIDAPGVEELVLKGITMKSATLEEGRVEVGELALVVEGQDDPFLAVSGDAPFAWKSRPELGDMGWPFAQWPWLAKHLARDGSVSLAAELRRTDPNVFLPVVDGARAVAVRLEAEREKDEAPPPEEPEQAAARAPPGPVVAATQMVNVCEDSDERATRLCPRTRIEEFPVGKAPRLSCSKHRPLSEMLELGGRVRGSLSIGGTVKAPEFTAAELHLNDVRISAPDGPSMVRGIRGDFASASATQERGTCIELTGFSADWRGLRVTANGYVETARLLSDGFAMVPQQVTIHLLGPRVVPGDPWAGARVLATPSHRWRYQYKEEDSDTPEMWFSPELDDSDWEELRPGDERPAVEGRQVIRYRKRFKVPRLKVPRGAEPKHLALAIESMMHKAELYVNGRMVDRFLPRLPSVEVTESAPERGHTPPGGPLPLGSRGKGELLAQRWAVEVTDFVTPGEENTIALRLTTVRKGRLPAPGPVRLGEVRGFVVRDIAGLITAERKKLGDPLDIRVGGLPSEGIDERHVSARIGKGKVRLSGGIEVASDGFKLAELAKNEFDLSLRVNDITPRCPPYLLQGRVRSDGPIRVTAAGNGENATVRGRLRLDQGRVSLPPPRGGGGADSPLRSVPQKYPQPRLDLALDIGRDVHFVTPPLYLSSAGGNGGGIPLTINAPLPLRETRDALVIRGTPYEPMVKLDTEVAHNVQFSPPGGGRIGIRQTAVGFEFARAPGVQEPKEEKTRRERGLPLAGRMLACIRGVRNMDGGSFSFILVSPDYRRAHPGVLDEYEDVLESVEGRGAGSGERQEEHWVLATRPARIADRGTRELLFLAFWPFGRVLREGGPGAGEVALSWASERVVGRLEQQILRPIEDLLVESGLVDRVTIEGIVAGTPSFQVGKDIIDNLYVTYQRQLTTRQQEGLQSPFTFTVGYRVRDRYELDFTTDERREQRLSVEYRVPF